MLHRCGPELDSSPGRKKFQPFLREKDGKGEGDGCGEGVDFYFIVFYLFIYFYSRSC